jgi:integrase
VALACGLRQGEALGLRWRDVDLDAGTRTKRVQLQRIGKERVLVEPKAERSRRALDVPAICVAALRRHRVRQAEERLAAGAEWEDWGLVFTTRRGTPLDGSNVAHSFHRELEKAGIHRHQRFPDLRHTCASFLLLQGISPRVVMELLGHSQIGMTMNLFTHVMPSSKRDAADRMHELLSASG